MTTLPDCRFCLENDVVTEEVLASDEGAYLLRSNATGDYLIIPKDHIESLLELPDDWWLHVKQMLHAIPDMAQSYNFSLNYGKPAGQTVAHLHFWIIARNDGEAASGMGLAKLVRLRNEAAG